METAEASGSTSSISAGAEGFHADRLPASALVMREPRIWMMHQSVRSCGPAPGIRLPNWRSRCSTSPTLRSRMAAASCSVRPCRINCFRSASSVFDQGTFVALTTSLLHDVLRTSGTRRYLNARARAEFHTGILDAGNPAASCERRFGLDRRPRAGVSPSIRRDLKSLRFRWRCRPLPIERSSGSILDWRALQRPPKPAWPSDQFVHRVPPRAHAHKN
jgi:hypothetical protein